MGAAEPDPGRATITRLSGDPPSPYEVPNGFCRVVRAGPLVIIAGTTSGNEYGVVEGATPYEQAAAILRKLGHELARAGAGLADVIQTRIYVTDASRSEEVGRAHGEFFGEHPPAMTLVEISGLIDPRMLVEIEATAYLS
jgi:enamine deaminase RidA (YjgF/YER057c/UK114 family)